MDNADAFVSSFLEHAGDQLYDPVKAHQYYEKTKQLTGRKKGKKTRAQIEGWSYAQSQIRQGKKTELDSAATNAKAAFEQLRANADGRRKALSKKLETLSQIITGNVIKEIAALPVGLSKQTRALKVAQIYDKANKDRASGKLANHDEAKQLVTDLKTTVESARANYKKLREGIQAKYDGKRVDAKSKFGV